MTSPASSTRSVRMVVLVVVAVLVVLAAAGYGAWRLLGSDDGFTDPEPTGEKVSSGLERFYDQSLTWRECGTARCTKVTVPVDYEQPDGDTVELSVRLYPADERSERTLFVNPGGPGGSATDYAGTLVGELGRAVTATYDVVGVDPRGVGRSTPLQCLSDTQMDDFVATDPDPEDDAELTALRRSITDLGEACEDEGGELAGHVSTEEAARDMDVVRALLGRDELDWFGASYGTQLGATYAHLFPQNVGRMVLDGAVDPTIGPFGSALGQATGFQRAFDAYAAECVKQPSCPVGSSVDEARSTVADLLDDLDGSPLEVGDRQLTQGNAFYGIAVTLYSRQTWDYLSQGLQAALEGDGTVLLALSDAYFGREADGSYQGNIGEVIYAVNCLDVAERPSLAQVEKRLPQFEKASPVFGRALGWGVLACTDWPLTSSTPQGEVDAEGAPPIVVIGTTRDPATPYEWARSLADQLGTGVLVSRDGDGHTAYASGNDCIDDLVDTFFTKGTVPRDGTECPAE